MDALDSFAPLAGKAADLPVLFGPERSGEPLMEASARLRTQIETALLDVGGVLLRGFSVPDVETFRRFAESFGHSLLRYEFASTPRTHVNAGVYTSTEYPAHQHIPLHSEQAYAREWPMRIWFHCVVAPARGGETPIADNRRIYERIPPSIRKRFAPGVSYVRNYGAFDVPWQKVFATESRSEVEAFCSRARIDCQWSANGELRTQQLCQAIEAHPVTGQSIWFNQAHLFHISSLPTEVREVLVETLGVAGVPRNVYFADGSPIPDTMLEDIRGVLTEQAVLFPWRAGDVLMLDNMLVSHARTPFEGPRKVVVAMAQTHGNLDAPAIAGG